MRAWMVVAVMVGAAMALSGCSGESKEWGSVGSQGTATFVAVDESRWSDRSLYADVIDRVCADQRVCNVQFFENRDIAPRSLPMTEEQLAAQVAVYQRNRNTGMDRLKLRCDLEPSPDDNPCI